MRNKCWYFCVWRASLLQSEMKIRIVIEANSWPRASIGAKSKPPNKLEATKSNKISLEV